MAFEYQILSSSPAITGTHVSALSGTSGTWKSASNPVFAILKLDTPQQVFNVRGVNDGAAIIEILGLPSSAKAQGASAKEGDYLVRLLHFCRLLCDYDGLKLTLSLIR